MKALTQHMSDYDNETNLLCSEFSQQDWSSLQFKESYQRGFRDAREYDKEKIQSLEAELEELRNKLFTYRWIPVSERLPEEGISVLAWGHMNEPGIAWRREGMWEDVEEIWLTGITHWMPLPHPPEVD